MSSENPTAVAMSRLAKFREAPGEVVVAPSLLSSDFARLGEEARDAERSGADMLHVDCMDGHFVPNLTIGPCVIRSLRRATDLPLDVHLMIAEPERYLDDFLEAGSDLLTFHLEAVKDPGPLLERISGAGAIAGLAIRPGTPVERLADYQDQAGMMLIMSVEPGFGGQSFLESVLPKIEQIREWKGPDYPIEVDGGVDRTTAVLAREAGANVLVAGTAIFGADDRAEAIQSLRGNGEN